MLFELIFFFLFYRIWNRDGTMQRLENYSDLCLNIKKKKKRFENFMMYSAKENVEL